MTDFKRDDKVIIRATVQGEMDDRGNVVVATDAGDLTLCLPAADLQPAPEPSYVEPQLVPGMVVMSEDRSDKRLWHYFPDGERDLYPFRSGDESRDEYSNDPLWSSRNGLPDRHLPVFDPREVPS